MISASDDALLCCACVCIQSTAASTLTMPGDDRSFGNVGIPLTTNLVKLVDVPEMVNTQQQTANKCEIERCLCIYAVVITSSSLFRCFISRFIIILRPSALFE